MIMKRKSRFALVVALLAVASVASAETPAITNAYPQIETLIKTLRKIIVPPRGTERTDVEAVYGQPTQIKNAQYRGVVVPDSFNANYHLLAPPKGEEFRANLSITYTSNKVQNANLTHIGLTYGHEANYVPSQSAVEMEDRVVLLDLLEILSQLNDNLKIAKWNQ
jgi:hypothetical protein